MSSHPLTYCESHPRLQDSSVVILYAISNNKYVIQKIEEIEEIEEIENLGDLGKDRIEKNI